MLDATNLRALELTVNSRDDVTAVGIGSAGIKIVSLLSRKTVMVDRFAYVSCDDGDFSTVEPKDTIPIESPVDQKLTPAIVRGLALRSHQRLREAMSGSRVVFVVAGLGGATGSGLAPVVASIARECGAIAVGVAVMPFDFEKKTKFYAGVSLRRLRAAARGVVVIDNEMLLRSSSEDTTLADIYDTANKAAVKALGSLLSKAAGGSRPMGLNKLLGAVLGDGYSLLGVSSSNSEDKAEDALAGAVVSLGKLGDPKEATRALVSMNGDSTLSAPDVGLIVDRVSSATGNPGLDVEYGVDYSGTAQLQVSLLASGFDSTKYDDYDPIAEVLGDRVLDDEMDCALPEGLDALQCCD
jgi:cell division protein FtsZ